jgi:hypothetical protein
MPTLPSCTSASTRRLGPRPTRKLHEARDLITKGVRLDLKNQTLRDFLEHWLENSVRCVLRTGSVKAYSMFVRVHLVPELGGLQLQDLRPEHIERLLGSRLRTLKHRTVRSLRGCLQAALAHAFRLGLVPINPVGLVRPPRVPALERVPPDAVSFGGFWRWFETASTRTCCCWRCIPA